MAGMIGSRGYAWVLLMVAGALGFGCDGTNTVANANGASGQASNDSSQSNAGGHSPASTTKGSAGGATGANPAAGGATGVNPAIGGATAHTTALLGTGGITGSSCPGDAPCGGNLDGTWQIVSTCVEGDLAAALNSAALEQGLPAQCATIIQSASMTSTGTFTFANGEETDNATMVSNETIVYTSACFSAISGTTTTLTSSVCATLQSQLDGMTCTLTASANCQCSGSITTDAPTDPQPYTVSGSRLTYTSADAGDPVDYCVSGTTLTMRQRSTTAADATLVLTLHKL